MNEDRNIYVNYETKDESGKYINPVSITFNGQVFDLKKYSFKEVLDQIMELDKEVANDINCGKVKRVDRISGLNSLFLDELDNEKQNKEVLDLEEDEPKKVESVEHRENDNKTKKNWKKAVISVLVAAGILLGVGGCAKHTGLLDKLFKDKNKNNNHLDVISIKEDLLTQTQTIVENSMKTFSSLTSKYKVDEKEYFISAEEWLTAYIYLNSYDYTIQELSDILSGNPNFYSKMSDYYRSFCEKMMTFNIVSDEPALSKNFFKNEEAYNIYLNYFNTFKKAQNEPNKENKKALEELTKEIYGLTSVTTGARSIYEEYKGVSSIIGHTLTTSSMMLGLITQGTYDNAMGIYNYDKNGNLIENHGPIEMVTCNDIELNLLDKLNVQIMASAEGSEDVLQPWFDSLNEKYQVENEITESDALSYVNEVRNGIYEINYSSNTNNNTSNSSSNNNSTSNQSSTSGSYTEEEKRDAEAKADQEFEAQYADEKAKEQAYGNGMSDAMSAIEQILAIARQNETAANSVSDSDIIAIGNSLKNTYTGSYRDYYNSGVDVAVNYGKSELQSIKDQYKNFDFEDSEEEIPEEIIEEGDISQDELDKQEDNYNTSSNEETYEEISTEEELTDELINDTNTYEEVVEEYLTQEELEQEQGFVRVR